MLGTGSHAGMDRGMALDICRLIRDQGWEARHDTAGLYRGGYIVRHYADGRKVCGVQLEISRSVRGSRDLRRAFSSALAEALAAFGRLHLGGGKDGGA